MRLFVSWSGRVSQQIAEEIRKWLPLILQSVHPFITTTDIEKGARWQSEISRELQDSNFGILCLCRDNLSSRWLAFEAGALSKHLAGRAATVLFGLTPADLSPPLSMFQATLFNKTDMLQLVKNINNAAPDEQRRRDWDIDTLFEKLWPDLEAPVRLILEGVAQSLVSPPAAPDLGALAVEMISLLRQQNAMLSDPEKLFGPVLDKLATRMDRGAKIVGTGFVVGSPELTELRKERELNLVWDQLPQETKARLLDPQRGKNKSSEGGRVADTDQDKQD